MEALSACGKGQTSYFLCISGGILMASTVYFYTMDCRTEHQNKESKVARLCNLLKLKDR